MESLLATAISAFFLSLAVVFDLRWRKIPNYLTLSFLILGISTHTIGSGASGFFDAASGTGLGFILMLLPFLFSGMGAGDVKAMAALGALIGPSAVFQTFLYTALAGGAVALVYYVIVYDIRVKAKNGLAALLAFAGSRDIRCLTPQPSPKKHKFPYAPAIALGYGAYLAWGNLV
jgi:prepilin peptidase CpaA